MNLSAPSNITFTRVGSEIIISWNAPPTSGLLETGIVYCVEVYNITCGALDLLVRDCTVSEQIYTSGLLSTGYVYRAVITPRTINTNGMSASISGIIICRVSVFILSVYLPTSFCCLSKRCSTSVYSK